MVPAAFQMLLNDNLGQHKYNDIEHFCYYKKSYWKKFQMLQSRNS